MFGFPTLPGGPASAVHRMLLNISTVILLVQGPSPAFTPVIPVGIAPLQFGGKNKICKAGSSFASCDHVRYRTPHCPYTDKFVGVITTVN